MDRDEVLRILTDLDNTGPIAEVHFDMSELAERAEAIAQAAEEEKQVALEEASVEWHKADDFRLAKMVLMASALYHIKIEWWDKHYPPDVFVGGPDSDDGVNELVAIRQMIDEALSAALKVAIRARGMLYPDGILMIEGQGVDSLENLVPGGQQVEVFVTECSVLAPESQNSEQSDAQGQ